MLYGHLRTQYISQDIFVTVAVLTE